MRFASESHAARPRLESTLAAAADHALEAMHRAEHSAHETLALQRLRVHDSLLKGCAAHSEACWSQPAVAQTVLQRLQELAALDAELAACRGKLDKVAGAHVCLRPYLQIAEVCGMFLLYLAALWCSRALHSSLRRNNNRRLLDNLRHAYSCWGHAVVKHDVNVSSLETRAIYAGVLAGSTRLVSPACLLPAAVRAGARMGTSCLHDRAARGRERCRGRSRSARSSPRWT